MLDIVSLTCIVGSHLFFSLEVRFANDRARVFVECTIAILVNCLHGVNLSRTCHAHVARMSPTCRATVGDWFDFFVLSDVGGLMSRFGYWFEILFCQTLVVC